MDDVRTLLLGALRAEGACQAERERGPPAGGPRGRPVDEGAHGVALSEGGYAIETVVDAGVNRLIPDLAAGATDILELPISKIVPDLPGMSGSCC